MAAAQEVKTDAMAAETTSRLGPGLGQVLQSALEAAVASLPAANETGEHACSNRGEGTLNERSPVLPALFQAQQPPD